MQVTIRHVRQRRDGPPGPLRQIGDLYATDIPLTRTLSLGETMTLEYWTCYEYGEDPVDPGERQYRRAVMATLDNFDMRIELRELTELLDEAVGTMSSPPAVPSI